MPVRERRNRKHLTKPESQSNGHDYCGAWQKVSNGDSSNVRDSPDCHCRKASSNICFWCKPNPRRLLDGSVRQAPPDNEPNRERSSASYPFDDLPTFLRIK
jgi:hypothetical protein